MSLKPNHTGLSGLFGDYTVASHLSPASRRTAKSGVLVSLLAFFASLATLGNRMSAKRGARLWQVGNLPHGEIAHAARKAVAYSVAFGAVAKNKPRNKHYLLVE